MLLNDAEIRAHCTDPELWFMGMPLVSPFNPPVQGCGVVSYGATSAGYDATLDNHVLVYKGTRSEPVDPKRFKDEDYRRRMFDEYEVRMGDPVVLPGHTYALVQTRETFALPAWLKGRCVGKSTYARCGLIVNTTPLEPEWWGRLTVEVYVASPTGIVLYTGEGIAQMEFERITPPEHTYATKDGKYQGQRTVTPPRVK